MKLRSTIKTKRTKEKIVRFIKKNTAKAIIGLSGGVDSTVCAHLAVEAVGKENVYGLILPFSGTSKKDIDEARKVAEGLKVRRSEINIDSLIKKYKWLFKKCPTGEKRIRIGNFIARVRMAILYDFAKMHKGFVLGTSNRTEILLGYFTKYGDGGSDLEPIGCLYKTQVKELAEYLGLPSSVIEKKPTAGFWSGQTDESELGIKYEKADDILHLLVDKKYKKERVINMGHKKNSVEKILKYLKNSLHKRKMPPIPRLT